MSINVDITLTDGTEFCDLDFEGSAKELDKAINGNELIHFSREGVVNFQIDVPGDDIMGVAFDDKDIKEDGDSFLSNILTRVNSMSFFNGKEDDTPYKAFDDLTNVERTILTMFYLGGRTDKEIAKVLEMKPDEVASIRNRAADHLFQQANGEHEMSPEELICTKIDEAIPESHQSDQLKTAAKITYRQLKEAWNNISENKIIKIAVSASPVIADITEFMCGLDAHFGIKEDAEHYMSGIANIIASNQQKYEKIFGENIGKKESYESIKNTLAADYMLIIRTDV